MFGTAIIVFREVLEAAMIVGIVAAATHDLPGRNRWLWAGIALGLLGSVAVAAFMDVIAAVASGIGQELFNAAILGVAVLMLAWHNIWMSAHGAELAARARHVGREIQSGTRELSVILVVVGLAVLREGSETVLFLYGIAAGTSDGIAPMLTGGIAGVAGGIAVGYAMYAGLLHIPVRWFFAVTGTLVLLLAAGMASQMAGFLIQADLLPSLAAPLWDTSAWVPQNSLIGRLLHSLVGYDAQPAGMQIIFYVSVLIVIAVGMKWVNQSNLNLEKRVNS